MFVSRHTSKVHSEQGGHTAWKAPLQCFFSFRHIYCHFSGQYRLLHSYARVFKGAHNSSGHSTTVRLVQPMPSLTPIQYQRTSQSEHAVLQVSQTNTDNPSDSLTEQSEQILQNHQSSSRKRPERSSPLPSPIKLTHSPAASHAIEHVLEQSTEKSIVIKQNLHYYRFNIQSSLKAMLAYR